PRPDVERPAHRGSPRRWREPGLVAAHWDSRGRRRAVAVQLGESPGRVGTQAAAYWRPRRGCCGTIFSTWTVKVERRPLWIASTFTVLPTRASTISRSS